MNVDYVIKSVTRQFGDETGAQIDVDDILRWINDGQLRISRRTGSDVSAFTGSVPLGSPTFTLPVDFFKVSEITLTGSSGNPKQIQVIGKQQMLNMYPNLSGSTLGVTKFAAVSRLMSDTVLYFAPVPSETVAINLIYKNRPPVVNDSFDELSIPEEYIDTLITYCLAQAKQLDGDLEAYQLLIGNFNGYLNEDVHDEATKDSETYPFIRVGFGDYYA